MANSTSLEGRTALITGSGGGMGRSHAVLMSARGADIIVHDIKADGANETAEMVQKNGRKASVIVADVRDVPALTAKIKQAESEHGTIEPRDGEGLVRAADSIPGMCSFFGIMAYYAEAARLRPRSQPSTTR